MKMASFCSLATQPDDERSSHGHLGDEPQIQFLKKKCDQHDDSNRSYDCTTHSASVLSKAFCCCLILQIRSHPRPWQGRTLFSLKHSTQVMDKKLACPHIHNNVSLFLWVRYLMPSHKQFSFLGFSQSPPHFVSARTQFLGFRLGFGFVVLIFISSSFLPICICRCLVLLLFLCYPNLMGWFESFVFPQLPQRFQHPFLQAAGSVAAAAESANTAATSFAGATGRYKHDCSQLSQDQYQEKV